MPVAAAHAKTPGQNAIADLQALRDLIATALARAEGEGGADERLRLLCDTLKPALAGGVANGNGLAADALSDLQRRILRFLSQGLSNRLIAKRLAVREDTVKCQVRALLDKLNVPNRTALALWAIRTGVVPLHA